MGQVVVVGSALMFPADDTEHSRSVSGFVAVTVTFPDTVAPTKIVPKSIWSFCVKSAGGEPTPVRLTMTDPATTSVPAAGPVCAGVNDTEIMQVPAAASVLHVFAANANGDGWTIVGVNEVAGPRLVTVTE